jgi:1,2-diacylglycerol 3-beta-galactosyltransferase
LAKRIVFWMSDTGGGHRAAAEAISEALYQRHGTENVEIELVDIFRECRWPLNKMPEFYPWLINKSARLWGWGYHIANTKPIYALNKRMMYRSNRRRLREVILRHKADVVVSVHSILTPPMMYAYRSLGERPPVITVVTDLVSTPRYWYDRRVDFTFLPTQAAYDRGLKRGMLPEKMKVVGLPVHPRFSQLRNKDEVRREHGWDQELPAILLVAGGDGVGVLQETALAIDALDTPCQLVIITGKNAALKARLEAMNWKHPAHIYGFVKDMPDKMTASDILVTKAGPATISEAFITGLPVILSGRIPGQEDGNVWHVVDNDAGVFANTPAKVAQTVYDWLSADPSILEERKANARKLANPNAVWEIADAIWDYADYPSVKIERKRYLTVSKQKRRNTKALSSGSV